MPEYIKLTAEHPSTPESVPHEECGDILAASMARTYQRQYPQLLPGYIVVQNHPFEDDRVRQVRMECVHGVRFWASPDAVMYDAMSTFDQH